MQSIQQLFILVLCLLSGDAVLVGDLGKYQRDVIWCVVWVAFVLDSASSESWLEFVQLFPRIGCFTNLLDQSLAMCEFLLSENAF